MADTNTTWAPIDELTAFQDDAVFEIDQKTKGIQVLVEQPIVAGENKSQFIKFQMGRYYDAIDLTGMEVNILYESPTGYQDISSAVNREYSDEYIRFGWIVPYAACPVKGTLSFAVEFVGADYTLKTTKSTTEVLDSIAGSSAVPEPVEQTWYIGLQSQTAATLQAASDAMEKAQQIINALATPQSAALASEMVDTSTVYVYTGSENGYSYGYWYFHNGTSWVRGGKYVSTDYLLDSTLSNSGQAADAQITGGALKGIEKLNFENVTDITGELLYMMESGYIRVSSGAMTFQANTANMRTPQNYPVTLKAGDVFTLNDSNYRYQYLYNNNGTSWATTGWKTAAFTVGADTQAYVIIGTADNSAISDLPALLKAVTVTRSYNATYKREVKRQGAIRNLSLAPNTVPYTLECGYIRVASGATTFEDLKTTLRTPEDAPVTLSPRDIISVASGYRYQFIYLNDAGTAWTGTGWKTVDWQMPASVFRTGYIVVGKSDNSVIGDDAGIYKAVTITHTVHKADFEYRDFYDSSHRGYQYIAPESTRASFSLAKKYGYNTIECDIRLTSDNYMVIHHNEGMPSNSSYLIAEHTLAELRTNANMRTYAGEAQEILTIDDLLMLCKVLDLNVFIELKATLTDAQKTALVQKIKACGMSRKAFIICNVNDATFIYRANDEYIGLLLNYSAVDSYIAGLINGKGITAIYNRSSNITAQAIQDAHNAGVKAIGWCVTYTSFGYTEETAKAEILRCINAGIDGMTIDQWTCANLVSDTYGI